MTHESVDSNVRSRRLNGVTQTNSNETKTQSKDKTFSDIGNNSQENIVKPNETQCNNNNGESVKIKKDESEVKYSLWKAPPYNNEPFIPRIRWPDLCAQIFLHVGALYGLIFHLYAIKFYTLIWCKLLIKKESKEIIFDQIA